MITLDDRPRNLPLKDFLIKKLAIKMLIPESTVRTVIEHQFQGITEAMSKNSSVEITGFGKFVFQARKAEKYIGVLEKLKERETTEPWKLTLDDDIELLKTKLYGDKKDSGGLEEHDNKEG